MSQPEGPRILLRIRDGGSSRVFRYYGKHGRCFHFVRDDLTHTHICEIPLDDWRANDYAIAKDLLEQPLTTPIIPDVTGIMDVIPAAPASHHPDFQILATANADLAAKLNLANQRASEAERLLKIASQHSHAIENKPSIDPEPQGGSDETSTTSPSSMTATETAMILGNRQPEAADHDSSEGTKTRTSRHKKPPGE